MVKFDNNCVVALIVLMIALNLALLASFLSEEDALQQAIVDTTTAKVGGVVGLSVKNDPPVLVQPFENLSWNEGRSLTVYLGNHFSDPESISMAFISTNPENITITIDDPAKIALLLPDYHWYGSDSVVFSASDGPNLFGSNAVSLTVNEDLDLDNVSDIIDDDIDGDGFLNSADHLLGNASHMSIFPNRNNLKNISVAVAGSSNLSQLFSEVQTVKISSNGLEVVSFTYNFSAPKYLRLRHVEVFKQEPDADRGYTILRGLGLSGDESETILVDKLNPSYNSVCVIDMDNASLSDFSDDCTSAGETLVVCDGLSFAGISCSEDGGRYRVSGRRYSAVQESQYVGIALAPVSAGVGGGAGGISLVRGISVYDSQINVSVEQDEVVYYPLRIVNRGNVGLSLNYTIIPQLSFLEVENLPASGWIYLHPGGMKQVMLRFFPTRLTQPGVYLSAINLRGEGVDRSVPIIVVVKPITALLDVSVSILDEYKSVSPGAPILARVGLYKMVREGRTGVGMEYAITDIDGRLIYTEKEIVAVETKTEFVKRIMLPKSLLPGKFVFSAKAGYGDQVAIASETFDVVRPFAFKVPSPRLWLYRKDSQMLIVGLMGLVSICLTVYVLFRFRKFVRRGRVYAILQKRIKHLRKHKKKYNVTRIRRILLESGIEESKIPEIIERLKSANGKGGKGSLGSAIRSLFFPLLSGDKIRKKKGKD